MNTLRHFMLAACVLAVTSTSAVHAAEPLQTVPSVDLKRYQGRWYQIAYYPNAFQKQCVGNTTADYRLLMTGQIEVTNRCSTADGSVSQVVGAARLKPPKFLGVPVARGTDTAKLEVRFAPSFLAWLNAVWAPYWVIQLADDYRYVVVGEPQREYLWILSRTPELSAADRATIEAQLVGQGYDVSRLKDEPQTGVR
jgi:apolipoprotein D and lipocalin family protein